MNIEILSDHINKPRCPVVAYHPNRMLFLTVIVFCFICPLAYAADHFHGTSYGYNLDIPAGWVEIPRDIMQEKFAALLKDGATSSPNYDAGFQLESADEWFDYPYVLVQVIDSGIPRQLNENEFPMYVRGVTGMDTEEVLAKNITADAQSLFSEIRYEKPQLDTENRRFHWILNMNVEGIGAIRGLIVGYFGRESIIQVMFYTRSDDWERQIDVGWKIIESFRFDEDKAYSDAIAAAQRRSPSIWSRILEKGAAGALMGALIGGIAVTIGVLKRKNKTRED